jgi:hypothetical protein
VSYVQIDGKQGAILIRSHRARTRLKVKAKSPLSYRHSDLGFNEIQYKDTGNNIPHSVSWQRFGTLLDVLSTMCCV